MSGPEDLVIFQIPMLGVTLLHCPTQKGLCRLLLIVLNLTHDQNLDNFRPIIFISSLFIGIEETIGPENLKRIYIAIKKVHNVFGHSVLLRPPVYDIIALINVFARMFQHMVVEKVLNRPYEWPIILHLRLY